MTGPKATATRRFLVPDLEGDLADAVSLIEDLLHWFTPPDEDLDDQDLDWWMEVPASLLTGATAVGQLAMAIRRAAYGQLYAPSGFEYMPMATVEIPGEVMNSMRDVVTELARIPARTAPGPVVDIVTDFATSLEVTQYDKPRTPAWVVELAARVHGVCDLEWGSDQDLLAAAITPGHPQTLTAAQEAAYQSMTSKFLAMWHDGDHLAAYLYRGLG